LAWVNTPIIDWGYLFKVTGTGHTHRKWKIEQASKQAFSKKQGHNRYGQSVDPKDILFVHFVHGPDHLNTMTPHPLSNPNFCLYYENEAQQYIGNITRGGGVDHAVTRRSVT
jgi:hypothetical protein